MASRFAPFVAVLAVFLLTFLATTARAQTAGHGNAVHILEIDSDDADDQAEALTGALRSHLRSSTGWNLIETTQSLSMLTAALRCPRRPDPACLAHIGDRLKADRFIWGLMNKAPGQKVAVELHFWSRGKPEQVAKQSYSDNLKDQNDDALNRVATSLLDQIIGGPSAPTGATVNVDAAGAEGTVVVDGEDRAALEHGRVTLQVTPGPHVFEVHGPTLTAKQNVDVRSPSTDVTFQSAAGTGAVAPAEPGKPFPTRAVVGWSAVVAGAVLLGVGALELKGYLDAQSVNNAYAKEVPSGTSIDQACAMLIGSTTAAYGPACPPNRAALSSQSSRDSALAGVFAGVGAAAVATGLFLVLTGKHAEEEPPPSAPAQGQIRLLPQVSPLGGGLDLRGTF